jgi:hypothetical protein
MQAVRASSEIPARPLCRHPRHRRHRLPVRRHLRLQRRGRRLFAQPRHGPVAGRVFKPAINARSRPRATSRASWSSPSATDPRAGLSDGGLGERFSNGWGSAAHVPTILIENHSLKPHEQRVLGTYVFLEAAMRLLAERRPGPARGHGRRCRPAPRRDPDQLSPPIHPGRHPHLQGHPVRDATTARLGPVRDPLARRAGPRTLADALLRLAPP